jgi:hypothetical protein
MSTMYALLTRLDATNTSASQQEVTEKTNAKEQEIHKNEKAIADEQKKEEDAKNDSGGFFGSIGGFLGTIADVGAIVGASVAAIVTGGAALPLAVAAVSVANFTLKETGAYAKMGDVGAYLEGGISLASGIVGGFVGGAGTLATIVNGASAAAGGVADGAEGIVSVEVANDHGEAQEAGADAKAAEQRAAKLQRMTEDVIEALKETHASHQHAITSLQNAMNEQGQTLVAVTSATGRA